MTTTNFTVNKRLSKEERAEIRTIANYASFAIVIASRFAAIGCLAISYLFIIAGRTQVALNDVCACGTCALLMLCISVALFCIKRKSMTKAVTICLLNKKGITVTESVNGVTTIHTPR